MSELLAAECVICDRRYLVGERGSGPVTCSACVALRLGLVDEQEAVEMRLFGGLRLLEALRQAA